MHHLRIHPDHRPAMRRVLLGLSLLAIGALLAQQMADQWSMTRHISGYTALHTALELTTVIIAMMIFSIGWSNRKRQLFCNINLLACSFLAVAVLDVAHLLSYPGMADFVSPNSTGKAIDFWLAARTVAFISFLLAVALPWQQCVSSRSQWMILGAQLLVVAVVVRVVLYSPSLLPPVFIEGQGLTSFKRYYEYALMAMALVTATILLLRMREPMEIKGATLFAAACCMAMSEWWLTFYSDASDGFNFFGHVYKVIACLLLYRAIFVEAIEQPQRLLTLSERRLRTTIQAIPDSLLDVTLDGRIHYVHTPKDHDALADADITAGQTVHECLPADIANTIMGMLAQAHHDGTAQGECSLTVAGVTHWYQLTANRVLESRESRFIVLAHSITRRKQQEGSQLIHAQRTEALLTLNTLGRELSEQSFMQRGIELAEAITGSRIAFINLVHENENTIELLAWSSNTLNSYCHADYDAHYPVNQAGIWAEALRQRKPVVINDYATVENKRLPEGHAHLDRFITLPVKENGQVRLIAGVGNKPTWYTEQDVESLQLIANTIWHIVSQRRFEAEAQSKRLMLEQAGEVAQVAGWLIHLPGQRMECSDRLFQIYDLPMQAPLRWQSCLDCYLMDDQQRMEMLVERCIGEGVPFDEVLQIVTANGERKWVRNIGHAMRGADGTVIAVQGALQDISRIKELERQQHRSDQRYRQLFQTMDAAFALHEIICDDFGTAIDYRFTEVNTAFERMLKRKRNEIIHHTATELFAPLEPMWIQDFARAALHGEVVRFERYAVRMARFLDVTAYSPAPGQFATILNDITARKASEDQLLKLSMAVEQSPNSVVITDLDANIQYVNHTFTEVTGYTSDEVMGENPRILHSGKTPREIYDDMWGTLTTGQIWRGELINRTKDGREYVEFAMISPVRRADGEIVNYLAIKENITDKKEAESRIRRLLYYDQLTGLANRTLLTERLSFSLATARRKGGALAVLFLDLDDFQTINDSVGHGVGDRLLQEVAQRLMATLRDTDILSRPGGDEFIIVLSDADVDHAALVATRLLEVVALPFLIDGHELNTSVSIGIALYPDNGTDFESLAKHADAALHRIKQSSRNGFCFFTPEMGDSSNRKLILANALRSALGNNEMELHYQPQVSLHDGSLIGMEALLRWSHPELGAIRPDEFIHIAEESGQIIALGEWVILTAARQMQAWLKAGMADKVVAVNLSAVQFNQSNLVELTTAILDNVGLPHHYMELELTEAAALNDPKSAMNTIDRLHQQGFHIAIDDFGTGYSSLSYLKQFKVDKLKIDQSFVRDILNNAEDQAIVTAIVHLANSLGLATIAEGVEEREQMHVLQRLGCDEIQGYYVSKPLPAAQFEVFARNWLPDEQFCRPELPAQNREETP